MFLSGEAITGPQKPTGIHDAVAIVPLILIKTFIAKMDYKRSVSEYNINNINTYIPHKYTNISLSPPPPPHTHQERERERSCTY